MMTVQIRASSSVKHGTSLWWKWKGRCRFGCRVTWTFIILILLLLSAAHNRIASSVWHCAVYNKPDFTFHNITITNMCICCYSSIRYALLLCDTGFYRAAYMQGGLSDRKGVRPSVCLSQRELWQSEWKFRRDSYTTWKVIHIPFRTQNGWWGRPLLPEILGRRGPPSFKKGRFSLDIRS